MVSGCASFQMKFGVTTILRMLGILVGFCGPTRDQTLNRFRDRSARLKAAVLVVLYKSSMAGTRMLGKIADKVGEILGR